MAAELTKKEKYLIASFKFEEPVVKQISEIGRFVGTHKYDVWIAKEVKKNDLLLNNLDGFIYIIDWANRIRPNISGLSFEEAYALSETWHKSLKFDEQAKNKVLEDDDRILYRCPDGKHYFILLGPEDLELEGHVMKNCVGSYKDKVKSGRSLIVSLRDENNESRVTIEVDSASGQATQTKGRYNENPSPKYLKLITFFAIHASGYSSTMDKELLELMNMKFE